MSQLILIGNAGLFKIPATSANVTADGAVITPTSVPLFTLLNSSGIYIFQKLNATNASGLVRSVAAVSAIIETTGSLAVVGSVKSVARVTSTFVRTIKIIGTTATVARALTVVVSKNGQSTAYNCLTNSVGAPSHVKSILGTATTVNVTGLVSTVARVSAFFGGAVVVVVQVAGSVESVAYISSIQGGNNVLLPMCFITMTLVKADGVPVGRPSSKMVIVPAIGEQLSRTTIVDSWDGVKVTCVITTPEVINSSIITADIIETITDDKGYAKLSVFQGYSYRVSSSSIGSVIVDTTGLDTVDISTIF